MHWGTWRRDAAATRRRGRRATGFGETNWWRAWEASIKPERTFVGRKNGTGNFSGVNAFYLRVRLNNQFFDWA